MRRMSDVLSAPFALEYPYTRSVGPVMGRFFAGLRDRRILGARTAAGRVIVPPTGYDPETSEPAEDLVEVGPVGTVTAWTWIATPRRRHPLDHPFAWALIRLDRADTALLHAVDAGDEARVRTGVRVRPRWRDETVGHITDIVCFEVDE